MADRHGRIKTELARNISDIVTFKITKQSVPMRSVSEVDITDDLTLARVYVTFPGSKYPYQDLKELNKCKGFVRSTLAKRMNIYKVPQITFVYDEQFDKVEAIEKALKKEEVEIEEIKQED